MYHCLVTKVGETLSVEKATHKILQCSLIGNDKSGRDVADLRRTVYVKSNLTKRYLVTGGVTNTSPIRSVMYLVMARYTRSIRKHLINISFSNSFV